MTDKKRLRMVIVSFIYRFQLVDGALLMVEFFPVRVGAGEFAQFDIDWHGWRIA